MAKTDQNKNKDVAVVGAGIAGLSAAWHLSQDHNVTIYEANGYLGGHTHTVEIEVEATRFPVDTGFIVFNPANYPNLTALFDHLKVTTRPTDMSFSASIDGGAFEYAGGDSGGLLAQPSNLLRPRFWSMVLGILRFYRKAKYYAEDVMFAGFTLRELLEVEGYSKAFIEDHLAPMGAAIWSSDSVDILDYPAHSFLSFFNNHGLTQLTERPQWRTVVGGSHMYVREIEKRLPASTTIRLNSSVAGVSAADGKVHVETEGGKQIYDHVILASHSDQSRSLLKPNCHHHLALNTMRYSQNRVVLHSDVSLMPKREKAWASWNYLGYSGGGTSKPAVSYWMNQLQDLPVKTPVIVTLNPDRPIDSAKIYGEFEYDHPVFDNKAQNAKEHVWSTQGSNNIWLAGAYLGDGFHEDGIQSGLAVAEMICGRRRPWHHKDQNKRIGFPDLIPLGEDKAG